MSFIFDILFLIFPATTVTSTAAQRTPALTTKGIYKSTNLSLTKKEAVSSGTH